MQRQAVTDELTGLFNHRRFQEVMAAEVERTKRFGHDLGLIMLDIDNFKQVNDDYGHLQGDLVLREVARVLRESSREIDEPARYGGEEMAVALPQTGLQGAYEFAERVRRRIEELELPLLDGSGNLRVTASFGAAALPRSADIDKDALFAAADARALPGQARGQEPHRQGRVGCGRTDGTARRCHPRASRPQAPPGRRRGRGRSPGERGARAAADGPVRDTGRRRAGRRDDGAELDAETRHYAWEEPSSRRRRGARDPAASVAAELYEEPRGGRRSATTRTWLDDPVEDAARRRRAHASERPPTTEFDARTDGRGAAAEDVLEETPDFLQETPEHDRLWFEQRPAARLRLRQVAARRR